MEVKPMSTPAIGNNTLPLDVKPAVEVQKPQQKESSVEAPSLKEQQATTQEMLDQVGQVNSRLEQLGAGVSFSVDESTQSPVIKVIDRATDEVIKQFPNEGSLKMMQIIQSHLDSVQQSSIANKENLTGVLFSEII
jgi:flagellar protein FlaG